LTVVSFDRRPLKQVAAISDFQRWSASAACVALSVIVGPDRYPNSDDHNRRTIVRS